MKQKVQAILASVYARALVYYRAYPARSISYIVAAVVAVGGFIGVTVDADSLSNLLTLVLPILLGGEAIHRQVTPVASLPSAPAPVRVQVDGAKVAKAVVKLHDPLGRSSEPVEVEDGAPKCRHGHAIDGSNGAYCAHGHAA